MKEYVKDSFDSWNIIGDNNNIYDILYLRYLTNTTSYSKNFCFSKHNIYYMIDSFLDNFIFSLNMQD